MNRPTLILEWTCLHCGEKILDFNPATAETRCHLSVPATGPQAGRTMVRILNLPGLSTTKFRTNHECDDGFTGLAQFSGWKLVRNLNHLPE